MIRIKDGFKGERSLVMPKMIIDYISRDPFCRNLYITDIGYYPHAMHHFRDRQVPVEEYVFIYCVEGSGWYQLGNVRHLIRANQFFVLPAGQPHSYGADPDNPWSIYWMHFKGESAHNYAEGLNEPREIVLTANSRIAERIKLFEEMLYTLKSGLDRDNLHYAHSILPHFLGSLRYVSVYRNASSGGESESSRDVGQSAIHFMKERIEQHITLQQLADYTGYSPNHFAVLFKKAVGYAPLNYFNLLKMQAAADMLDSTAMKVNQIAAKLGYDDTGYFTRLFTRIMGKSPRDYRSAARG